MLLQKGTGWPYLMFSAPAVPSLRLRPHSLMLSVKEWAGKLNPESLSHIYTQHLPGFMEGIGVEPGLWNHP